MRRSLYPKTYTPRLACVKPAASVHPEPGSNSSSYILILYCDELSIGSFRILQFYYSYSFVLRSLLKRLSIQYVYERVFLYFLRLNLFLKAGAKLKIYFVSCKKNLKNFETFFSPHFLNFPTSLSNNFPHFAGCKCNIRFPFSQAFRNIFLKISSLLICLACQYFGERLSLLRVQKYTTIPLKQAFLESFFILFLLYFLTN